MANANTATAPAPRRTLPDSMTIVSHSSLYYWWWVWAFALIMGLISWFSGYSIATVPNTTHMAKVGEEVKVQKVTFDASGHEELGEKAVLEKGQYVLYDPKQDMKSAVPHKRLYSPRVTVSASRAPGVIFCFILLLIIGITNIPLRGLWSLIVAVVLVAAVVILSLMPGAWDWILTHLSILDIRISTGGYFVLGLVLLILWLLIFLLYDPQMYMVFTPGSFRVRLEIGEGETAYDTRGMTIQKVRSDFFRHWILGLGSGDIIVKTSGAQIHEFHLSNVLFVNRKIRLIEEMIRTHKEVVG
jgi:hypothetical protein